jgi:small subunit ribosomal protein S18
MVRNKLLFQRQRFCTFCAAKVETVEYKAADTMKTLMNERGKIIPRRKTGTCAKHQRHLATAVKRARHLALLPYEIQ